MVAIIPSEPCCGSACAVPESRLRSPAAARAAATLRFLCFRSATRVTRTHSPRRAALGMVRAMNTTAPLASALLLRSTPCGFRSAISAWRRTARSWHVARMRQTIQTIDAAVSGSAIIGSVAGDAVAVMIRNGRCRGTDSGEAG